MATRRLRLLVCSTLVRIRYIGTFRSKSTRSGSLQNESRAGKGSGRIEKGIHLVSELSDADSLAFAQLMKRIGFNESRQNAIDDDEAYLMRDARGKIASAPADVGYGPR